MEEITTLKEEIDSVSDCSSQLVCQICHKIIKENQFYSLFKNQNGYIAWHYECYARDNTEVLTMSHKTKVSLAKFLLNFKIKGGFEPWMAKVLTSCGYNI